MPLYSNWEEFYTVVTTGVSTGTGNDMSREREQKLIDLMYEIGIKAYWWYETNPDVTTEQVANWVTGALRDCGFNVKPMGCAWGVLDNNHPYIKVNDSEDTGGITIVSANRPD